MANTDTSELEGMLTAIVTPLMSQVTADLRGFIDEQVQPLQTALSQLQATASQVPDTPVPEVPGEEGDSQDPVSQRLKLLEAQLQETRAQLAAKEAREQELLFNQDLGAAIATKSPLFPEQVLGTLASQLRDGAKQDSQGRWLTRDGKELKEAVDTFFASDFGKHMLPPSDPGSGTPVPGKVKAGVSEDLGSLLMQTFI